MYKSITQDDQNDKQISKSIRRFFTRFHVSSVLKAANAYKKKGTPAMEIFQYLFLLIFSNRSMYMNLISGRNTPAFAKDTIYRFMKMLQINWLRFTTILAARIIRDAIVPLDSEDRANVLIIDDSMFERNSPKKWNFSQKYMTMQNTPISSVSVCSHADGLMEVRFFLSTVCFFHPKTKRTGSMRQSPLTKEP